jgi:hypothetical protein
MAAKRNYETKAECLAAIDALRLAGIEPFDWMLEQLEDLEEAERTKVEATNSDTPI